MSMPAPIPVSLPCCTRTKTQLLFETAAGQRISLGDTPASIHIEDANGNAIRLDPSGITISAASVKITLTAAQLMIDASQVTINTAVAKFSGIIQADTVIANKVVASSYTPGVGNIM
jgi:hypothetical protein